MLYFEMAKPEQRETFCSIAVFRLETNLSNLMLKSNVATSPMEYDVRTKNCEENKKMFLRGVAF